MSRIFTALGIDYLQWRALTKAALTVDLRASMFVRGRRGVKVRAAAGFVGQFVFYTFTGAFIAAFVFFNRDLFLAASLVLSYVMFMVGTAALLDHNATITSPDDYNILGFRPVASRTYFAARLTNVLVYTSAMTTLFAYLPIVVFFLRWGVGVGVASVLAVYGASFFIAFAMVAAYSWLLQTVGAQRLKRMLSYVQFAFSFLVYGGFFLITRFLSESMIASLTLPKTVWVLMAPPAWFASYVELAAGRASLTELLPALASVLALAALLSMMGGRLSLGYADRLGVIASTPTPARRPAARSSRTSLWFRTGEARAIAMLIRSQFANDMKFRMSVLAILPLTIIYLAMGISRDGTIADPFVGGKMDDGLSMVTLAILMFPGMLKISLARSDAFRASWIFFACPADRTRLVRAAKDVLVATFVLPYLAAVGLALAYFSVNVTHLLIHLVVVALVSHLALQVTTLLEPELPFSKPLVKGRSSTRMFIVMMAVGFGAVFFPLLAPVIYRSTLTVTLTLSALVGISIFMEWLTRVRIEAQTRKLEFEG